MFIVDNLLLSPFTSLLWVFKEIGAAVQQDRAGEAESVTRSLGELYMKLETGAITEEQFAAEEKQLLDRLDAIELRDESGDDESDEGEVNVNHGKYGSSDEPQAPRVSKGKK